MSARTVVVYGPHACGKTRNAEALRKGFGLDRVIDDWNGRDQVPMRGALVLTNCTDPDPPLYADHFTFAAAMQHLGLPL